MDINEKPLIIYHGDCKDGFCAAWVLRKYFKEIDIDPETVPMNYGMAPTFDVKGRRVFILDFSFPRDILEAINKEAVSLRVLDHHKSAEEALKGLSYCTFDMDRSGAGMTWDYIHGKDHPRPWIVDYVEDRDLWRFRLPDSKRINAFISSLTYDFELWDQAVMLPMNTVTMGGATVQRKIDEYVESCIGANLILREFPLGTEEKTHVVPVINAPHVNVSELLDVIIERTGAPFAVAWRMNKEGKYAYSLRSRKDFDVAKIAEKFGGGGHKNACGFISERLI